jgi:hypothetical protein
MKNQLGCILWFPQLKSAYWMGLCV